LTGVTVGVEGNEPGRQTAWVSEFPSMKELAPHEVRKLLLNAVRLSRVEALKLIK